MQLLILLVSFAQRWIVAPVPAAMLYSSNGIVVTNVVEIVP